MAVQCSQLPQGLTVGPLVPSGPMQFMPLAMMRAVVVFSGSANAGHDKGLGDAIGFKSITQGLDHRLLPNQIGKGLWSVFAR